MGVSDIGGWVGVSDVGGLVGGSDVDGLVGVFDVGRWVGGWVDGGGGAPATVPRMVSLGVVPRGVPRRPAEAVLCLTSARATRISSHT